MVCFECAGDLNRKNNFLEEVAGKSDALPVSEVLVVHDDASEVVSCSVWLGSARRTLW